MPIAVAMQREDELLPPILEPVYDSEEQRLRIVCAVVASFKRRETAGPERSSERTRAAEA